LVWEYRSILGTCHPVTVSAVIVDVVPLAASAAEYVTMMLSSLLSKLRKAMKGKREKRLTSGERRYGRLFVADVDAS
jgi:hypothetical protein